jgi:phage terminase large subunit-like protein
MRGTEWWDKQIVGQFRRNARESPFFGLDFSKPPIAADVPACEDLAEVAICIDPTETAGPTSDEAGLVAMGRDRRRHVYVLEDLSGVYESERWGELAIDMAERWDADVFLAENNRGLPLVTSNLNAAYRARRLEEGLLGRGALLPIKGVQASSAKGLRASPVRQLYLTGQLHHCPGLTALEAQMRGWRPDVEKHKPRSDDRIDALVHGATYLAGLLNPGRKKMIRGGFSIPGIM